MTIFLVRHAHAGSRSRWSGDDALRPLSDRGHEQANGLVEVIGDAPIGAILSSPYVRCMETVVPLAAARSVAIEPTTVLAEGADFPGVLALIAKHADTGAVLCTHGDIIPSVLDVHVKRLRAKVEDDPTRPTRIVTVRGVGYRYESSSSTSVAAGGAT